MRVVAGKTLASVFMPRTHTVRSVQNRRLVRMQPALTRRTHPMSGWGFHHESQHGRVRHLESAHGRVVGARAALLRHHLLLRVQLPPHRRLRRAMREMLICRELNVSPGSASEETFEPLPRHALAREQHASL